ncbi:polymorphic toxin-type HINT domain-containing protein [Streptomyces sp. NPDC096198]|uniref:polymorphic toxin-type HINT domain-containing protein n=1 Tax=Streptomyces sp. NPDC096198 TaxID=3366080 RepID=UPI00381F3D31
MATGFRAVPGRRGIAATLIALALLLGMDIQPAAADDLPDYNRADVLEAWRYGGPGVQRAAAAALTGSDEDVQRFMSQDLPVIWEEDLRVQVAQVMAIGGPGVRAAANTALNGGAAQLKDFLNSGFEAPYDEDLRVQVAQIMANGGPGVKAAAGKALDGTPDDLRAFIEEGQFRPREDDNRIQVLRLMSAGGPNVKQAAQQAMDGTPEDVQAFLDDGWQVASARDQETLTVSQLADLADHAQKQAKELTDTAKEEAAKAAAATQQAMKAAQDAAREAQAAKSSAGRAAAAASRAAAAADRAAQSARTAVSAAAAANSAARVAAGAAAQAAYAAGRAGSAASSARSAAAAAAGDATRAKQAREAAENARKAAAGARKAADAADQAGIAADNAAKAAGDAASAGMNAAAAAAAAADAGRWAGEAGSKSTEAQQAAARAQRLADQATRAANAAQANANQAATAARQSRNAANAAAAHAEAAATAADKAADQAGKAVDAAKDATAAANEATRAADDAQTAADQAANVADLARKADAERLAEQQDEDVLAAEEANSEHETQVAQAQWEAGRIQQLDAETQQLVRDAAASTDPQVTAAKGRQAAVNMLSSGGSWVQTAAETAVTGTDADVAEFVRTDLNTALEQDDRASVAHIAETSDKPAQQQAALDVLDKPADQVREFLRTRAYPGKEDDDRVAVAQLMAQGGPGVKAAGSKALDGTAADVQKFLDTGQYTAREDDDRVAVAQALAQGGPEVKAAAQAVLSGPPAGLRSFLQVGLYRAKQRDANAAAHLAEVNTLLLAAYKSAALARKDAADAQKVAATARKDATKATEWATKANQSAKQASDYSTQANKSANDAAASADRAAESARTARNAAAAAQKDAQSAARSAEQAQHSASLANGYAYQANISAYQAGESAEAAGKDAVAAAQARSEAMKIAADKLVAELKAQVQQEAKNPSKPISDAELRTALEKRLFEFRREHAFNGDIKAGDTVLVCGGDGAGGMGCITSTYLDRLVAWYLGVDEIQKCLDKFDTSCMKDLALSALKMKLLRKTPCAKNSFVPGTRVLMADRRTKPIEDVRVGDRVLATDPGSGRTEAEPVQATITGQGTKQLVDVTVSAPRTGVRGSVTATTAHPFWVGGTTRAWVDAGDLRPGLPLRTASGASARVAAATYRAAADQRVHNLTVAELHTYYVLAGTTPVLVHNNRCPNGRLSDKLPKGMTNEIADAYDSYKRGELVSHDVYQGREWPKWEGAKEYAVPGGSDRERILVKTLPNGIEVIGWTSTHYEKIQRFTAPHFPDWGWTK